MLQLIGENIKIETFLMILGCTEYILISCLFNGSEYENKWASVTNAARLAYTVLEL